MLQGAAASQPVVSAQVQHQGAAVAGVAESRVKVEPTLIPVTHEKSSTISGENATRFYTSLLAHEARGK